MRAYISGPISNIPEYDSMVAFNEIENKLVAAGCEVVNPRITSRWGLSWETYMQIAQAILHSGEIDVVVLLKGWEQSRGACIERVWAKAKGIQILEVGKLVEVDEVKEAIELEGEELRVVNANFVCPNDDVNPVNSESYMLEDE